MGKFDAVIERELKRMQEAEQVRCSCGYVFDQEDLQGLITYWAEDGPQERDCPACDRTLIVTECVQRTYEVEVCTVPNIGGE